MEIQMDPRIREYLLAVNIFDNFFSHDLSATTDIYDAFALNFPDSKYRPKLSEQYEEAKRLSKGAPAPDLKGLTLSGQEVVLSDMQGKLIYLDIWATWCGPCIEQFPYSKKLNERYSDDDVAFVYLSIDKVSEDWGNFLKEKDLPDGHHLIEKESGSTYEAFQIWGIPRYVLIDREGKIISAHAPRPSSAEIVELLDEYTAH